MKKEIPENGLHAEYYNNGNKKSEGNYKDGKKSGKWMSWHKNGLRKYEVNYKDGKEDGERIQWDDHIEEKVAKVEYYPEGYLKAIYILQYYQGTPCEGRYTSYYSNGGIESLGQYYPGDFEVFWRSGDLGDHDVYQLAAMRPPENIGDWNYWYENGSIKAQCYYEWGARVGRYIGFYKNGQKKIEKSYIAVEDESDYDPGYEVYKRKLSLKSGIAIVYRRDGTKKIELNYKDGKKNGKCREWDKKGQLVSEVDIIIDQIKKKKDDLDESW